MWIRDRVIVVAKVPIALLIVCFDITAEGRRMCLDHGPMRIFQPYRGLRKLAGLLAPGFVRKVVQLVSPTLVISNADTLALEHVFTRFEER
jgi:hypothetical protein